MSTCSRRFPLVFFVFVLCGFCHKGYAVSWFPFGPNGGDARSFAADPHDPKHVYLGTDTGWIYESKDEGKSWKRLALVSKRDDLVLDNIEIDSADPKRILVGAWVVDREDGGLYESKDGGVTWSSIAGLRGQSIRALAQSPSNPKIWVAGTLSGVQRSEDNGEHWEAISPKDSKEIHEVESVAIDPVDPKVIYAGTWHLPWKTTDGGATWKNIKTGVIDDSDVFSIIVDPEHPSTVYASACSGIYKSDNAGLQFQKVEGIPSSARRTRVLMQDPKNRNVVFAGTTEGLFRTGDGGKIWIRMTGPDVIVNDVYIDPTDSNKLLLATDRGGVLASDDGGTSFLDANNGFSARHLSSFVSDVTHPASVYVGALNDKQWGGVFHSEDGGLTWVQQSGGLMGSDVFSLGQAPDGTIIAGTGHGLYRWSGGSWVAVADVLRPRAGESHRSEPRGKASLKRTALRRESMLKEPFDGAVYEMATNGNTMFAASSLGLLQSMSSGLSWQAVEGAGDEPLYFIGSAGPMILAAGQHTMRFSKDGGVSWKSISGPAELSQIDAVAVDGDGGLWAGGREGVFQSLDNGASWQPSSWLTTKDVNSIFYDARTQRILVTTTGSTLVYALHVPDHKITFWDTGWHLRFVRPVGDHLMGVTPFNGVVIQPRMVDSAVR